MYYIHLKNRYLHYMLKTYFIDLFHNIAKKCPERTKLSSIVIAVLCEDALDRSSSVAGLDINR